MLKVSENFCLCKHHDTCIYHIFKCYIDKNNGRCRTKDYKSLCGTKQFSRGRFYCNDYICKTIEEMRNILNFENCLFAKIFITIGFCPFGN